jgi:membrane-bound lytic murein transglycosylase D
MVSNNKILWIAGAILLLMLVWLSSRNGDQRGKVVSEPTQKIPVVDPDGEYTFAGEALPVDDFDVRERLERELIVNTFWHTSTILAMKLANRYFPAMEKILKEENVPQDFKYLAVIESGLRPVSSVADARGIWQFMEGTARDNGLEVSSEVDERYHVEKSTRAACQYLKALKKRFGSWQMAAAAYNMGGGNLAEAIQQQRATSYFDLNVNEETARYLFRATAMKEIMENPEAYGFAIPKDQLYSPLPKYRTVKVNGAVDNWGDFAMQYDISYRTLKIYNPWMRSHQLTNSKQKVYEVKVPR